jgi:antitoxin component of RelBE/YafQ-DinJ toxin-antitoxin module
MDSVTPINRRLPHSDPADQLEAMGLSISDAIRLLMPAEHY